MGCRSLGALWLLPKGGRKKDTRSLSSACPASPLRSLGEDETQGEDQTEEPYRMLYPGKDKLAYRVLGGKTERKSHKPAHPAALPPPIYLPSLPPSNHSSIHLSIHPSVYPSIHPPIFLHLSTLSFHPPFTHHPPVYQQLIQQLLAVLRFFLLVYGETSVSLWSGETLFLSMFSLFPHPSHRFSLQSVFFPFLGRLP